MNGIPPDPSQTSPFRWKSCLPCSGRLKASTGTILITVRRRPPGIPNEIEIYAVLPQGAYLYKPETHQLERVVQGDMRAATGTQEFAATAPLNLVYVVDQSKQPGDFDAKRKLVTACTGVGFIGENVYLFCTSAGLGTVCRAMIDADYIQRRLKLPVFKKVLYAQSVGYPSDS